MSRNLTVRVLRLRLAGGRAFLDRHDRAYDGAVEHTGSWSVGVVRGAERRLAEKMELSKLASRAPGDAGLMQPRMAAVDFFVLAISEYCGCCFCVGAKPTDVRMGRRRRRECSASEDEKYPRPEQSPAVVPGVCGSRAL
jgi:hypothetical protein